MDPDTCFTELLQAVASEEAEVAHEHADHLLAWLDRGGFPPGGGKLGVSAIRHLCNWITANCRKED